MLDWNPLILTFKLAAITTCILLVVSIPLAFWLARTNSKIKPFVEAIVSLPLVLPPTVIGFYLLIVFNSNGAFGTFLHDYLGLQLVFSFPGLVLGSVIYSMPFMVQPLQSGFSDIPNSIIEASYILGKSKFNTVYKVLLPSIKQSIISGLVLTFAHTVGEFGVVLMIGGNIPSQTKVVSIAIYDEVESLNYTNAHIYSGILLSITFIILLIIYLKKANHAKIS